MSGSNAFKRGVQDQRLGKRIIDSKSARSTSTFPEAENTETYTQANGQEFVKVLPTDYQQFTDPAQLKAYPQYRLIRNTTTTTTTTSTDCGPTSHPFVECNLNPDVTEFLAIVNDIGLRIYRLVDFENFNKIIYARDLAPVSRDIVSNPTAVDTVSANVLLLLNELSDFLYEFGKKIAPPGVNPYLNNEKIINPYPDNCKKCNTDKRRCKCKGDDQCNTVINVSSAPNPGVVFPSPPYNPNDIDTFINCLDKLIDQNTDTDDTVDFNLTVFQTIIQNSKVTKFDDAVIDQFGVTRAQPFYSVMQLMLTLLKIDIKFMNILYTLNLHDAFRSPITNAKYGRARTRINMNGVPVPNNEVSNNDIFNAGRDLKEMLSYIMELISFVNIDGFTKIMIDHFAYNPDANPQPVPAPDDVQIIIDDSAQNIPGISTGTDNVPCFLYGQLLSFCDVSRLILANSNLPFPSANTNPDIVFNTLYEPSKVASIAVNAVFGMKAIMQLIENLLKSDAYLTVLNMIFPSGDIHESRAFDPKFEAQRINTLDFQSLIMLSIYGSVQVDRILPTQSVPEPFGSSSNPITINKVFFCDIYNYQSTISNMFWDSGAPFLIMVYCEDQALYDPDHEFTITTLQPTTSAPTTNAPTTVGPTTSTSTSTTKPLPTDVFDSQQGIQFLLTHKHRCVFTLNGDGRVICPLDDYIKAYANYIIKNYNIIAAPYEQTAPVTLAANRNIFNLVTRDIKYN